MGCCTSTADGGTRSATPTARDRNRSDEPTWDACQVLSCGANKEIFDGEYRGEHVAICVARTRGELDHDRLKHEIDILRRMGDRGDHPHIIRMLKYGVTTDGRLYLVQECVEPIGYDLDRMVNQYSFTHKQVPADQMIRILGQLSDALSHMHACKVVHRDLKTENVLVTREYNAKLIDMGIACEVGARDRLCADYLAPEICMGLRVGPPVDCWGLGVILHQVYQKRAKLVNSSAKRVYMRAGMPSHRESMEPRAQEAMMGLLEIEPDTRWTLEHLNAKLCVKAELGSVDVSNWQRPITEKGNSQVYVQRFRTGKPPLSAFAALVKSSHVRIVNRKISEISLPGVVVLLIDYGANDVQKCPGPSTVIRADSWIYFGVDPAAPAANNDDKSVDQVVDRISGLILEDSDDADLSRKASSMNNTPLTRNIGGSSELLAFNLEFDCFLLPSHIGEKAILGPRSCLPAGSGLALDMRNRFKINVAGILHQGDQEPIWFPGAAAEVSAGDLCLVVRRPLRDGSTESTVTDANLGSLMSKDLFGERVEFDGDVKQPLMKETLRKAELQSKTGGVGRICDFICGCRRT